MNRLLNGASVTWDEGVKPAETLLSQLRPHHHTHNADLTKWVDGGLRVRVLKYSMHEWTRHNEKGDVDMYLINIHVELTENGDRHAGGC